MLVNFDSLKTFYNILLQKLKNYRGNWEQNDPTADDYIKNRPFYSERTTITLVDNLTSDDHSSDNAPSCNFVVDQSYNVTWNGVLYENLVCYLDGGYHVIASTQNGCPFYIDDDGGDGLYIASDDEEWTVSISTVQETVHQVDSKYVPIPEGIVTEESLSQVAFSGDYNDLINQPSMPELATVATSGSYNDLSDLPDIPAAQVQSNLSETNVDKISFVRGIIRKSSLPDGYPYVEYTASELVASIAKGTVTVTKNVDGTFSKTRNGSFALSYRDFTDGEKYILTVGGNNCLSVWEAGTGIFGDLYVVDDSILRAGYHVTDNVNGTVQVRNSTLYNLAPDVEGTYDFGLYKTTETYYSISDKYLPDTVATTSDVEELRSLVGDIPVAEQITNAVSTKIDSPASAEVGQALTVKAVDEDGKPIEWEAATITADGVGVEVDATLSESGDAADAKVTGDRLSVLESQIADLMYEEISITSFSNNIGTVELGSTVTNVTLSWKTNKTPTTLTLDEQAIDASLTSVSSSNISLTSDKTWTLVAVDERDATSTKTTTIKFLNGIYYGVVDGGATINNETIIGLTKSLQSTKTKTFTVTANDGQHIVYALPASYGTPAFNVGGFDGGFSLHSTFDFTNSSGHTASYCVWISDNAGLGATTVKVS